MKKMSTKHTDIMLFILMIMITWFSGCAKYATSDQKIADIEEKVSIGMTEGEFTENVPNAQLINTTENKSVYAVRVSPPCFICSSAKGFSRSFESYATQFIFVNGQLVSFSRILNRG